MKNSCIGLAIMAAVLMSGCGGSNEPTNVMDGMGEEAMQSYEEMIAADEAMMSAGDASDEAPEVEGVAE